MIVSNAYYHFHSSILRKNDSLSLGDPGATRQGHPGATRQGNPGATKQGDPGATRHAIWPKTFSIDERNCFKRVVTWPLGRSSSRCNLKSTNVLVMADIAVGK